ncbi:MAG: glycosyltransferase family 87 protein, partial [Terracidiphilus sp.]
MYCGTRCLIHGHDPYNQDEVAREYLSEDGQRPKVASWAPPIAPRLQFQSLTLWVNLPTTFVVAAPFAALTWWPALILWMLLTGFVFNLAILLMWHAGVSYSPRVATFLACMVGLNCEAIFTGANAAGIVVGFCVIAAWCFLRNRLVWIGVLCLGLSLAVKPHDGGFVWLYFLLAGGAFRKRALQSAAIPAVIALASALWVSHVAPNWLHEWSANLAMSATHGGINDPGPNAVKDGSIY